MKRQIPLVLSVVATITACALILLTAMGSASTNRSASSKKNQKVRPRPHIRYDPSHYTTHVDNAWFPLKPGITYVFRGIEDGQRERDLFTVTHETRQVAGVTTRVIFDRVLSGGRILERTHDYYVQDVNGNVWYFGEDTAELDRHGNVKSRAGTWHAGVKGGQAGVIMEANPQPGNTYQQEFDRGNAEDHYQVLSLSKSVKTPYGSWGHNSLRRRVELTKEWSPLEPDVRDHKYYVRGIGEVKEKTVKGGNERFWLVDIRHG